MQERLYFKSSTSVTQRTSGAGHTYKDAHTRTRTHTHTHTSHLTHPDPRYVGDVRGRCALTLDVPSPSTVDDSH